MPKSKKSTHIPPAPPPPPLPGYLTTTVELKAEASSSSPAEAKPKNDMTEDEHESSTEIQNPKTDTLGIVSPNNEKPKPPTKPSRLQKALSSGSLTLPSMRRLSLKGSKKKERKRLSTTKILPEEDNDSKATSKTDSGQLREAVLWKLPGMLGVKQEQRSSLPAMSYDASTSDSATPTKERAKTQPHTSSPKAESTKEKQIQKRELPPIPSNEPNEQNIVDVTKHNITNSSAAKRDSNASMQLRDLPCSPQESSLVDVPSHLLPHTPHENNPLSSATPDMADKTSTNSQELESSVGKLSQNDVQVGEAMEPTEDKLTPPPPLPERIDNLTPSNSQKTSQCTMSEMALRDAIHKYTNCFPLRIKVLQGYCNEITDVNISTDDVYDIHFVKETKVVSVKDGNGLVHGVPLGTAQKFGLIYSPSGDDESGLNGHVFKSISEITSCAVLPKVICATQEARSSDGRYMVEDNEILVVKQIHRTLFKGKKGLKVYSLLLKTEKTLPDDCEGYFSTKPSLVRIHLPEIIEYVPKPFSSRAVMYSAGENIQSTDQTGDITGVVTIIDYNTEVSLVVSAIPNDEMLEFEEKIAAKYDTESDTSELFNIPLDDEMRDLEITVLRISLKQIDEVSDSIGSDHAYDDTMTGQNETQDVENAVNQEFPNQIEEASDSGGSDHVYDDTVNVVTGQTFILTTSTGCLNGSQTIPGNSSMIFSEEIQRDEYVAEDEMDGYDTVGLHHLNPYQSQLPRRRTSDNANSSFNDIFDGSDPRLTSWVEDLQTTTKTIEGRLMSLETNKESKEMTRMQDMLVQLTTRLESVDTQMKTISTLPQPLTSSTESQQQAKNNVEQTPTTAATQEAAESQLSKEESNKKYLSTLTIQEVCELLEAMSLGRYKEHIECEFVSGDILLEFDDDILKEELGIASKIQRIRLMKIISGQHSAKDVLKN